MSVKCFTIEEVKELSANPYVEKVSEKAITYTQQFRKEFYERYSNGESPSKILRTFGFDLKALGQKRISNIVQRCKRMAENGSFEDHREGSSGRPRGKERTPEEEIAYLKQKVEFQRQQIEALKKIQFVDRKKTWKQRKKNTD